MSCALCESTALRPVTNFCEECGAPLRVLAPAEPRPSAAPRDHLEISLEPALAAVSDRGLRHAHNEDFACLDRIRDRAVLVVCDGVSHSHRPAEAAESAAIASASTLAGGGDLAAAIAAAQEVVQRLAASGEIPPGMDPPESTIVAGLVHGREISLAWLGDSRAYFISASDPAVSLTRDHSWVNREVDAGRATEEEAYRQPEAGSIVRTLGGPPAEPGTLVDPPSFASFSAPEPGWLLLCTDGWWTYHSDAALLARLFRAAVRDTAHSASPALALARLLVDAARRAGGRDNITVAVLHIS